MEFSTDRCLKTNPHLVSEDALDPPSLGNIDGKGQGRYAATESCQTLEEFQITLPTTADEETDQSPRNWPKDRKWSILAITSLFAFTTPLTATALAPAKTTISEELSICSSIVSQLIISLFVLSFAFGPLLWGPLSEVFGRSPVLRVANGMFLVCNVVCAAATNKYELLVFRFLAGFGASATHALGAAIVGDLFTNENRGSAMAMFNLAPLLGPSIGPLLGAVMTQYASWRWLLGMISGLSAVLQLVAWAFLQETHHPTLSRKLAKKLAREAGEDTTAATKTRYQISTWKKEVVPRLAGSMSRPLKMLLTQPILQICALNDAFTYGIFFLVLSTFSDLWVHEYGQSITRAGVNYLFLGFGAFSGAQIAGHASDRIYARLVKRSTIGDASDASGGPTGIPDRSHDPTNIPEFRIPMMLPGVTLVPVGLCIYGWTAEKHTFWLGPDIGVFVFGVANIILVQSMILYIVGTYQEHTASALAADVVLRSLLGFALPLAAPSMLKTLGHGWEMTMLAALAATFGFVTPLLLWFCGKKIRAATVKG